MRFASTLQSAIQTTPVPRMLACQASAADSLARSRARGQVLAVFELVGKVEMVVTYRANPRARTPMRRLLSVCCTQAMRVVTGKPIRDAHKHFIVDEAKMALTNHGVFSHCLPLRRNVKATDGVMDAPYCIAIEEAENRLHVQKAVMAALVRQ